MGLRMELEADGKPLRLAAAQAGMGVVLAGEEEAPARRMTLEIQPRDAEAEQGLRLAGGVIEFNVGVEAGHLFVESTRAAQLRGRYSVRLRIDDLVVARGRWSTVSVGEDGNGTATFAATVRQIQLTKPVHEFDASVRAVVTGSRVDRMPAEAWVADPKPQAKRKACLLNLLAVLRSVLLGDGRPVIAHISELLHVATDHLNARVGADLHRLVLEESERGDNGTRPKVFVDSSVHPSHRKVIADLAGRLGEPAPDTFESFRFEGRPSLQIVFGLPAGPATSHLVDIDLDLGNPRQDLLGAIVHFGELFDQGLDHVKLRNRIATGPRQEFVYYRPA